MSSNPVNELATAAPPIAVSAAHFAGWQLSDVTLTVTLVYTVLMLLHLVFVRSWKRDKDK